MRRGIGTIFISIVLVFSVACMAGADDTAWKIEQVALFKNGLGFFTASVPLPDAATVQLGQVPIPSLGTFWIAYPPEVKFNGAYATQEAQESYPAARMVDLLLANTGKKVTLQAGEGAITGELLSAPAPAPSAPSLYTMRPVPEPGQPYPSYLPQEVILLKTETGVVAVNAGQINQVEFLDGTPNPPVRTQQQPSLRVELAAPSPGQQIGISFLAKGITWAPSYQMDLSDAKDAVLNAQAVIINEAADLQDVRVQLVTGFPNAQYAEVQSPLGMSQKLAEFLSSLATMGGRAGQGGFGGGGGGFGGGGPMSQVAVMSNSVVGYTAGNLSPEYSSAATGATAEDLFLYPLEKLSLQRGETVYLPLFTEKVPYTHVYTWKIPNLLDREVQSYAPAPPVPRQEEVWHCCRFTNTLKMPLTTAPMQFMKTGNFVGQDTCNYTAPGSEATVRINRALSIEAEQAEVEVERTRNAQVMYNRSYDRVRVRAELKLRSHLTEEVSVEVSKELSGDVLNSEPPAKDVATAAGLKRANATHELTWSLALPPGEERKIQFEYELYVSE